MRATSAEIDFVAFAAASQLRTWAVVAAPGTVVVSAAVRTNAGKGIAESSVTSSGSRSRRLAATRSGARGSRAPLRVAAKRLRKRRQLESALLQRRPHHRRERH